MMARARADEVEPILLLGDGETADDVAIEDKIRSEFNQADEGADWRIKVSRFEGNGKQEPECFECTPADFPITQRLREEHGAGKYRVRVMKNGKQIHFFQYAIEAPRTTAVTAVKSELTGLAATFQAAMDRQSQLIERLMEKVANQPRGGNSGGTVTELVTALGALQSLQPKQPESSRDTLLEVFRLGIEAAGGRAEPSDGGGILGFAERLLSSPIVQKIAEAATTHVPANAPPQQRIAPPTGTEGDATRSVPTDEERAANIQAFMRQQVLYLLGRANQWRTTGMTKSHPDLYAEWVIDNIPDEILSPLIAAPNAIQLLQQYVPEIEQYADWFGALLNSVRAGLTDEGDEGDIESRVNTNGAPADHVSSSPVSGAREFAGGTGRDS